MNRDRSLRPDDTFRQVPGHPTYFVRERDGHIIRLPKLTPRDVQALSDRPDVFHIRQKTRRHPLVVYHLAVSQRQGRMCVTIIGANAAPRNRLAAEIIALALQGPSPLPSQRVGYLDGNQTNLSPSNLLWTTDAAPLRLTHKPRRKRAAEAPDTNRKKATAERHRKILDLHSQGLSDPEVGSAAKVALSTVYRVLAGNRLHIRRVRPIAQTLDLSQVFKLYREGAPIAYIAASFSVNRSAISRIIKAARLRGELPPKRWQVGQA